jgi:ankyrin repeat protein
MSAGVVTSADSEKRRLSPLAKSDGSDSESDSGIYSSLPRPIIKVFTREPIPEKDKESTFSWDIDSHEESDSTSEANVLTPLGLKRSPRSPRKKSSERGLGGKGLARGRGFQSIRQVTQPKAGKTIFNNLHAKAQIQEIEENHKTQHRLWYQNLIIFPYGRFYRTWWGFTVFATALTFFFETYQIGFAPGGLEPHNTASSITDYFLISIFALDMLINFNLAFFNDNNELVYSHKEIAENYLQFTFWVDLVGVMPFYRIAVSISDMYLEDNTTTQYLALLRLFRLVRMRRIKTLFDILKFSTKVSLISLTLTRNAVFALVWAHFAACVFYFISNQYDHDIYTTWIGPHDELTEFDTYITTLYWSVVTFTTVGYGDFSPVNAAEQIFGMIYMLLNIIFMSYIIGSVTLLVVKNDEATGLYRDSLKALSLFAEANDFLDDDLYNRLKSHLKVEFNHRETVDEMILQKFPKPMRQKVLLRLYGSCLNGTRLMSGLRPQFVTSFLSACKICLFSSNEELLTRNSVSSDLFLLVEGTVELATPDGDLRSSMVIAPRYKRFGSMSSETDGIVRRKMSGADFINEVSFFTESPQIDTVKTLTVCKMLIISKHSYKELAQDHPGSTGRLLSNLLHKVRAMKSEMSSRNLFPAPKRFPISIDDLDINSYIPREKKSEILRETIPLGQIDAALAAIQDLVEMHINKQKDDHTTRFLFAASRGDTATVKLMCNQGYDPNSSDYDSRTALMIASMKGNLETVNVLLRYGANIDLKDHHGTCAILEAIQNGHDQIIDALMGDREGHDMNWLDDSKASALLNQAVYDGNTALLQRLVRAKINVNAGDYDLRRPLHIAAAEGNVAAFRFLEEAGADLCVLDRWNNSVYDETKRSKAGNLLDYLETHHLETLRVTRDEKESKIKEDAKSIDS